MPHKFLCVDRYVLLEEAGLVDMGAVEGEQKIVVAGNKACGKTCLIAAFAEGKPVDVSSSIAPQVRRKSIATDDAPEPIELPVVLKEVPSDEEFSSILKVACYRANAVLLCFALDDRESLNAVPKWHDEVKKHSPDAIRFVVGCKRDLKGLESKPVLVSTEQGAAMARRVGARAYITCSSKSGKYLPEMAKIIASELASPRRSEKTVIPFHSIELAEKRILSADLGAIPRSVEVKH